MSGEAQPMSAEAQVRKIRPTESGQGLIFISHRHADRRIADRLRNFFLEKSGNCVEVFQSSSADAQAPRIGQSVSRELVNALGRSDVLLLVYTGHDRGWDYCMWECGVATHPATSDTNVIVLQCGPERPRVFEDQLTVDIREPEMVRRFVSDFLTDPDFFPTSDDPVTRFQPHSESVQAAARELYEGLQELVSPDDYGKAEEWQAMPFVQLGMTRDQVAHIAEQHDPEQARLVTEQLLLKANVNACEGGAAYLFGKLSLPLDTPFGQIFSRPLPEGQNPLWLRSLADQIARAAQWSYPSHKWSVMSSANENDPGYYSPVLTRVRRFPSKAMQFDVHFYRFTAPPGSGMITLPVSDEPRHTADTTA